MGSLTIVTGSPGTGKTTLASSLAKSSHRGVHLLGDHFYGFIAYVIPPHLPESHEQNRIVIRATARAAAALVAGNYDVFMDGVFGPWCLPIVADEVKGVVTQFVYVVLRLTLDNALQKVRQRDKHFDEDLVRRMHAAFADLSQYEKNVIEVDSMSEKETEAEFHRRRSSCLVDPERIVSDSAR